MQGLPHQEPAEETRLRRQRRGQRSVAPVLQTHRLGEDRQPRGSAAVQTEDKAQERRVELRQAVHLGEDGPDADGQAVHDELGPNRVLQLLVPQPGVRSTRVTAVTCYWKCQKSAQSESRSVNCQKWQQLIVSSGH